MYVKKYEAFIFGNGIDDILESLNVLEDSLLNSISAKELNIYDTLELDKSVLVDDLETIANNPIFMKTIYSSGLKKSDVYDTKDFETFLKDPIKFMFISNINDSDLSNPLYILVQSENNQVRFYSVNNNIKNFYDKLSSKVIEIVLADNKKLIYKSGNKNEWVLSSGMPSNEWAKVIRKDDFFELIKRSNKNKNFKVNVI